MTKTQKARWMAKVLAGCRYTGVDEDKDHWDDAGRSMKGDRKGMELQFCRAPNCCIVLCRWCAAKVTRRKAFTLWCPKHARGAK